MSKEYVYNGKSFNKKLSYEEQNEFIELAQSGDKDAQELIVKHNLRLVVSVLNSSYYKFSEEEKKELYAVGCLGLWKSIINFDLSSGLAFSTYAVPMISGEIKRYLRDNNNSTHVPRSTKDLAIQILNLKKEYSIKHNDEELSVNDICNILNKTEEEVILALNSNQPLNYLSDTIYQDKDGEELTLGDTLSNEDYEDKKIYTELEKKETYNELMKALDKLTERQKKIILLYFGFNGEEKTQEEITKELGISQAQISREIKEATKKLKRILPQSIRDEYTPISVNSLVSKQQSKKFTTIYSVFDKYTKEEVDEAIQALTEEEKQLILLKYPCEEDKKISNKIIAKQMNTDTYKIISESKKIIDKLRKQLVENKYGLNYKKQFNYSKNNQEISFYNLYPNYKEEEVSKCIEQLNDTNRKIIELRYGLNGNTVTEVAEIAKLLNVTPSYVHQHTAYSKAMIKKSLENTTKESNCSKDDLLKLFPEYSEEHILKCIEQLNDTNKKIIELKYGLNGNNPTSNKDIAALLKVEPSFVRQHLTYSKHRIAENLTYIIEEFDKAKEKKQNSKRINSKENKTIFELFPDYTKEHILKCIEQLNDTNKRIIELKYGLNDNPVTTVSDIAEMLNVKATFVSQHLTYSKRMISKLLTIPIDELDKQKTKKRNKRENKTIFELFPDYTKEQILKCIEQLSDTNKRIIELRYGLNDNPVTTVSDIAEMLNVKATFVSQHLTYSKRMISKLLTIPIDELGKQKTKKRNKRENKTIFELFPDYTKEHILKCIEQLNDTNKKIIELRYGLSDNPVTSVSDIAEMLNVKATFVSQHLTYSKRMISKLLTIPIDELGKQKTKKRNKRENKTIFELFPDYTKEHILKCIEQLSDTNKKIIELRYGLNRNHVHSTKEISDILDIKYSTLTVRIVNIRQSINRKLEKSIIGEQTKSSRNNKIKTSENFFSLFPNYTKEQVIRAIKSLKVSDIEILELKYGLNGQTPIGNKEISEKLNIKYPNLITKISYIKKTIAKRLEEQKFFHNITEETENKKTTVEKTISVEEKILKIKNSILSNQYDQRNLSYIINGTKIETAMYKTNCLLTYKDKKRNALDRPHSTNRECYVYVITVTDQNNKRYQIVLVKDIKNNKFYKFVNRYTNGEYDLTGINNNELVCFKIGKIDIETLPIKEELKQNIIIPAKKQVIINEQEQKTSSVTAAELAFAIGSNLLKERKFVDAKKEFIKALDSNKRYILLKSNYYLGKIFMAEKKPIIAENYLQNSLKIDNNDYDSLLEIGKALSAQERYEEATKYFGKCNKIKPHFTFHLIEQGKMYKNQKLFDRAEKQFDLAILKRPTDYFAYFEKSKMLFELNKFKEAKQFLNVCDTLTTNKIQHKVILGKINYLEGNIIDAKKLFDECVQQNLNSNIIIQIAEIGHFFHEMGEKDLAYEYYLKASVFKRWVNISEEKVEQHIESHTKNTSNEQMHSIFNFPVSLDLLNSLIKDMDKTATLEMYDVYQIHCKDAGYMVIDENTTQPEDYITILTLPFTKKIMQSYPDNQIPNTEIKKSINVEDLLDKPQTIDNIKSEQINKSEVIDKIEIIEPEKIDIIEDSENQVTTVKKVEQVEGTIITDKSTSPFNKNFEENKDKFKIFINMLTDPTEQTILLLRLGFVRNKSYSEKEIAEFLNLDKEEVHNIINTALDNIHTIANLTTKSIESAKQLLKLTE